MVGSRLYLFSVLLSVPVLCGGCARGTIEPPSGGRQTADTPDASANGGGGGGSGTNTGGGSQGASNTGMTAADGGNAGDDSGSSAGGGSGNTGTGTDGGPTGGDGGGTTGGLSCTLPDMDCGGDACVDTDTSDDHCGACDAPCLGGASCTAGKCVLTGCDPLTYGGHDYLFCGTRSTWADARAACQSAGMDLVIVDDLAENTMIDDETSGDQWLGITGDGAVGAAALYKYIVPGGGLAGETVVSKFFTGNAPWDANEPDGAAGEDCVNSLGGEWSDENCDDEEDFVCESY